MIKLNRIAAPLMAVALSFGASSLYAQSSQTTANNQTTQVPEWNTPPAGTEQAQQGYRDGIEAAKLDVLAHRTVDAKASHLYVHPPTSIKKDAVADYRNAFETGYKAAVSHQSGM